MYGSMPMRSVPASSLQYNYANSMDYLRGGQSQRNISAQPTTLGAGGPGYGDVSSLFREALASLTGEGEKTYQAGKRRTLSDIAMQSVNAGMANTLNMPAAGIAYDEANRPAFNTMLGQQKAGILTGLGQTAAGMYGQNLGAQTSLQTANIGAGASMSNAALGYQSNLAQQGLEKYLAELRAAQGGGTSGPRPFYTGAFAR